MDLQKFHHWSSVHTKSEKFENEVFTFPPKLRGRNLKTPIKSPVEQGNRLAIETPFSKIKSSVFSLTDKCGRGNEFVVVLYSTPRVFLQVLRFFPLLNQNQHFQISIRSWNARAFLNEFSELLGAPWVNKLHIYGKTTVLRSPEDHWSYSTVAASLAEAYNEVFQTSLDNFRTVSFRTQSN